MNKVIIFLIYSILGVKLANADLKNARAIRRALEDGTLPDFLESDEFRDFVSKTNKNHRKNEQKGRSLQSAVPLPHPIHPVPPIHPEGNSTDSKDTSNGDDGSESNGDGGSDASSYWVNPYFNGANSTESNRTVSNSTAGGNDTSLPSEGDNSSSSSSRQKMYIATTAVVLGLIVLVPFLVVCAAPGTFFPKTSSPLAGAPSVSPVDDKSGIPMMVSDSLNGKDDETSNDKVDEEGSDNHTDLEKGAGPASEQTRDNVKRSSWFSLGLFSYTPKWIKLSTGDDHENIHETQGEPNSTASTTAESPHPWGPGNNTDAGDDDRVRATSRDSGNRQYTKASDNASSYATTDSEGVVDYIKPSLFSEPEKERLTATEYSGHSLIEDISGTSKQVDNEKNIGAVGSTNDAISI